MTTLRTFQVLYSVRSLVKLDLLCDLVQNEIEEIHIREVNRQRAAANAVASESEKGKAKASKPKQDTLTSAQPTQSRHIETDLEDELQKLRVSHHCPKILRNTQLA